MRGYTGCWMLAGALCLVSCGKKQSSQVTAKVYDSNHLHQLLRQGTDRRIVLETFGTPLDERTQPDGATVLTYDSLVSVREIRKPTDVIGFQVVLKSNIVERWNPVLTPANR